METNILVTSLFWSQTIYRSLQVPVRENFQSEQYHSSMESTFNLSVYNGANATDAEESKIEKRLGKLASLCGDISHQKNRSPRGRGLVHPLEIRYRELISGSRICRSLCASRIAPSRNSMTFRTARAIRHRSCRARPIGGSGCLRSSYKIEVTMVGCQPLARGCVVSSF